MAALNPRTGEGTSTSIQDQNKSAGNHWDKMSALFPDDNIPLKRDLSHPFFFAMFCWLSY